MRVLVTGGAGYIGSMTTEMLLSAGHAVVVLDNLSKGHPEAVDPRAELIVGDLSDAEFLEGIFSTLQVDAVMHFAASSLVGESVVQPAKYFRNNLANGINLLDAMLGGNVRRLVFSSTAAVYGEPKQIPIVEESPLVPTNPYGESKLAFERALPWYDRAYGLKYSSLRYFNAAGASAKLGEDHDPESHLIPLAIAAVLGKRPSLEVFGTDYPTADGTCVRDYIHVQDLAAAHILALEALGQGSRIYNLGNGQGFTVRQVLDVVGEVAGRPVPAVEGPRRPGDPPALVASSDKIRSELGWKPAYPSLGSIVRSAWDWHRAHPEGYES
ncbi:MAG: UDP-glucose 4-epimerase GalE [Chloroflexi bacterium]|nr:UDP-glucose 4-epimerase GalE [Chloroflexota bacterium]